ILLRWHTTFEDGEEFSKGMRKLLGNRMVLSEFVRCITRSLGTGEGAEELPQAPDSNPATLVSKEIRERLARVALHFEERRRVAAKLSAYSAADRHASRTESLRNSELNRICLRLRAEENSALSELVHLVDNVATYLQIIGQPRAALDSIERFRVFRVAGALVNAHKHGVQGRNKK